MWLRCFPLAMVFLLAFSSKAFAHQNKIQCGEPESLQQQVARLYKHAAQYRLAVSVYCEDKWLFNKIYAPEPDIPVDTLFFIGSLTKSFTAARVLAHLTPEKIDVPVKLLWPGFEMDSELSFAHLLSHDSGLLRHELMWFARQRSADELFAGIQQLDTQGVFGFHYSNLNYFLADYALSKIVQEPPSSLIVADHIMYPALGMQASLHDLNRWLLRQFNEPALQLQHQPLVRIPNKVIGKLPLQNLSYGLGWFVAHYRGYRFVFHGGKVPEGTSYMAFLPDEKTGIVVLSTAPESTLSQAVVYALFDQLVPFENTEVTNWWEYFKKTTPAPLALPYLPSQELIKNNQKYVGDYHNGAYGQVSVRFVQNTFFLDLGQKRYVLYAINKGVFEVSSAHADLKGLRLIFTGCQKTETCALNMLTEPESGMSTRFMRSINRNR